MSICVYIYQVVCSCFAYCTYPLWLHIYVLLFPKNAAFQLLFLCLISFWSIFPYFPNQRLGFIDPAFSKAVILWHWGIWIHRNTTGFCCQSCCPLVKSEDDATFQTKIMVMDNFLSVIVKFISLFNIFTYQMIVRREQKMFEYKTNGIMRVIVISEAQYVWHRGVQVYPVCTAWTWTPLKDKRYQNISQ